MNGFEQALVIILGSFLGLFLVVGIVLIVLVIKVVKSVKHITDKAETLVDKADNISDFMRHASVPWGIAKVLTTITDNFTNKAKKR